MTRDDVQHLLGRVEMLRHPCDVDLLLFFARHPRALLASEQLATWLGYQLKQLADSLEVLLEAGLLTRTQNPAHAARMYVFVTSGTSGGWLPSLLELASTREGRLAMLEELSRRASRGTSPDTTREGRTPPAPFVVRRRPDASRGAKQG